MISVELSLPGGTFVGLGTLDLVVLVVVVVVGMVAVVLAVGRMDSVGKVGMPMTGAGATDMVGSSGTANKTVENCSNKVD